MGCSCAEGVVVDHRTRMSARNDFAGHVTSTMSVEVPVRGRSVLVAGSSGQAMTVTGSLVGAGAVVTVICTDPTPYLSDLADRGLIALCERAVVPTDIDSAALVVAHTGSEAADASIATEATGRGAFCHAPVVDASKIPRGRTMAQSVINSHLISHALAGKNVVRLKGGDGFVFGRGGEEVDECVRAGITVNVIPGVSSAIAAPAVAMIPATHRGLTQGFTVISGHVPPGDPESTVNYAALAQANTTIVLMMAVANLDAITSALIDVGMSVQTPAAVIADGSLSSQRVVRSTLDAIAAAARAAGIGPPATAVIGAVAGFVPGRTANLPAVELNVR